MEPVLLAAGAYLVGSISFARLIGRWRAPEVVLSDVEYEVPGTDEVWVYRGVSATTVTRQIGLRWGLVVVGLDMSKGFLSTLITRLLWPAEPWYLIVGVLVVVGHVWPLWHRFEGGRGQSTLIGSMLVATPLSLLVSIVLGAVVGLLVFTSAHLARQGFGLYLWVWPLARNGPDAIFTFGLALSVVYLAAIWPDLREERRIQRAKGPAGPYWIRLRHVWHEFTSEEG